MRSCSQREELIRSLFSAAQGFEDEDDVASALAHFEAVVDTFEANPGPQQSDAVVEDADLPPLSFVASAAANSAGGFFMDEGEMEKARKKLRKAESLWSGNVMALVNLANIEREYGDFLEAMRIYNTCAEECVKILEKHGKFDQGWMEEWMVVPSQYCYSQSCYLLALLKHQIGSFQSALHELRLFGFKWRISPAVWKCIGVRHEPSIHMTEPAQSRFNVSLMRNAISEKMQHHLREAFKPDSAFWDGTNYAAGEYFSFWFDLSKKPSNLVELLIKEELLPLVPNCDGIIGAEWWVHSRPAGRNLGHQLHFDTEENSLHLFKDIMSPRVSSVCYLSGDNSGGPTVVFDQKVDDKQPCKLALVANPQDRGFLMFPGNRLHGVLPAKTARKPKRSRDSQSILDSPSSLPHRLTLLLGFWDKDVQKIGLRRQIGPCATFPRTTRSCAWPACLDIPQSSSAECHSQAQHLQPHEIKNPWELISDPNTFSPDEVLPIPCNVDQRFFVRDFTFFKKQLLEEEEA